MRRNIRRALWPLRLLPPLLATLLLLAIAAVLYVLYAPSGGALALSALTRLTHGQLQVVQARGSLNGPIVLEQLVYDSPLVRVEAEQVQLNWQVFGLLRQHIHITALRAAQVRVQLKATPPEKTPHDALTHLPFSLAVDDARIARFELQTAHGALPQVYTEVALAGGWSGDIITLAPLRATLPRLGPMQLDGRLRLKPRALEIVETKLSGAGVLQLHGRLGYDQTVQADARWQNLAWPLTPELIVQSADGHAKIDGRWQQYRFDLGGNFALDQTRFTADAQGSGSLDRLDFQQLTAHGPNDLGGEVAAQGQVAWSPQRALSARGTARGLDPSTLWPDWPGKIGGAFDIALAWPEGHPQGPPQGSFALKLRDSQLRNYAFALDTRGRYEAQALLLEHADVQVGDSRLQLAGRATAPYRLTMQLHSPDLAQLWPGLAGNATAGARLTGTRARPHLIAEARLDDLSYKNYAAKSATLHTDLDPLAPSKLELLAQDVEFGVAMPSLQLHADGTATQHRVQLAAKTSSGDLDFGFAGALDLTARTWTGTLAQSQGQPARLSAVTLEEPAALRISAQRLTLAPACWASANGRACVQITRAPKDWKLAFRLEDWAFAYFEPFLPPQWKVSGAASGDGLVAGDARGLLEARVDVATTPGRLIIAAKPVLDFGVSTLHAEQAAGGIEAELHLPLTQSGVSGRIDTALRLAPGPVMAQRALSGRVRIDLADLTPLRLFSTEIEAVSGQLHGAFEVSGTATHPRTQGALKLTEGTLRLATPGIELKQVQAQLQTRADADQIAVTASAQSGGGALNVQGQTDPLAQEKLLSLAITGENFQAMNTPQAQVWVSPKLQFDLARTRADLTGEIVVPRAAITARNLSNGIAPSRDQIIIGPQGQEQGSGLIKVYSNVRVVLGDDVRFDGYGLKSGLEGNIDASDEPGRPTQARGEIRLLDGRYKAYGQDLDIQTGRLIFTGGALTDPAIEVRAVRRDTSDLTVGIYVRGTLAAPQLVLFSTPEMTQEQQLSWLVLGHGSETAASAGERSALSSAALSLGLSGGSYLSEKFGGTLKLDEVSFGTRPGQATDQAQFTIGKYLSPKLFISYGIGLFQPGHSFRLLYDIGRHFKLSTESGIDSGGDLLYTIER